MLKKILLNNPSNKTKFRTYSTTIFFNRGEGNDINNIFARFNNNVYYPMWHVFGQRHEDESPWFATCSLTLPLPPGEHEITIHKLVNGESRPVGQVQEFYYEPAMLAGLNKLLIVPFFEPENSRMEELDYVNLLDPKYCLTPFPLEMGGKRVSAYSAVINNCRFKLTIEAASGEAGLRYYIQILNDQTKTTPGELKGTWKVMFVGGWAGVYMQNAIGAKLDFFKLIGETPITTFSFPLEKLGVTQSWMFGGAIRFDSYEELNSDLVNLNIGIMSRTSLDVSELPEFQLPNFDESYKNELKEEVMRKFNSYLTTPRHTWDSLGQSKVPAISGFQPQFGNFPTDVRMVLETATPHSLMNLLIQEMRVMSARPGWIDGLYYVDAASKYNANPKSTYTWNDIPHRTSLNRWGLERDINVGDRFGWEGQDAEHYGMTPAFWLAMLTGSYALISLFKDRAIMAQCHWHSEYYFGAWTDVIRSEGRLGRVLTQAIWLTGSSDGASFVESVKTRLNKILAEFKAANTYSVYGNLAEYEFYDREQTVNAAYGTKGARFREDIYCNGYPTWNNPQAVVCWQMGMIYTAFWKFYKKYDFLPAKEVVRDMLFDFVNKGFILHTSEGPVTGMKKYYAADNHNGYKTIGWSMDALTQWPMNLLTATPNDLLSEMDNNTSTRYEAVKAAMMAQWPDLHKTPWCAKVYN